MISSNTNQSSLGDVKAVYFGPKREMEAFDSLPKTLQDILRNCPYDITAVDTRADWRLNGFQKAKKNLLNLIEHYKKLARDEMEKGDDGRSSVDLGGQSGR